MKCLILSVFVFVLVPGKVYNFGSSLFAPFSGYGPRSKFDYDLSRFFPEFRIPPDSERYEYHDTLIINKPSKKPSENQDVNKDQQCCDKEDKYLQNPFNQQAQKPEVHYQFQHGKGPIDITQRFGASYGSSDLNTETNPKKDFGTPYMPFPVPPSLRATSTTTAKPLPGQALSYYPSQQAQQFEKPFTQPFGASYGSSYINTETNPQNNFGASHVPFNVPPPQITTTSSITAKPLPGQGYSSLLNQKTQQFGTPYGYQNEQRPVDTTQSFDASYGSSYINTETNPKNDFGAPSVSFTTQPPLRTTTTKTDKRWSGLLSSLVGGGGDIKYKETETDYYDFDETDLHRPKYDINASRQLFAEFVKKYGKTYKDKADEEKHYQIFVKSLNTINRLNSEGGTASFDINVMSDEDLSQITSSLIGK